MEDIKTKQIAFVKECIGKGGGLFYTQEKGERLFFSNKTSKNKFLGQEAETYCKIKAMFWYQEVNVPLKLGPKPIAKSTGKPDQRRRDNKNTPRNTLELKPSKNSKKE